MMTTSVEAPQPRSTPAQTRRAIWNTLRGSSGNLVEWYDVYVYTVFATYFEGQFFAESEKNSTVYVYAIFAITFVMRPVGSWFFGRFADRRGRRAALTFSVSLMALCSAVIALVPSQATIGIAAPIVLILARLVQGFATGGEYGTSATYMSEAATRERRGFFSSFQYVTLIGGQLLAALVVVLLQTFLTDAELKAWGWRIPFVIGAITAVIALLLRRTLHETTTAETRGSKGAGTMAELFRHHKAAFFTVLGYTAGGSLIFYTFTTYMQKFLVNSVHMTPRTATTVSTVSLFLYMCMQPLFGALSDRIGRRSNMMIFGALGAVFTVPIMTALDNVTSPFMAGVLITSALLIVSFYTSVSGIVKAEMFPPHVRALGVGLAYAIGNAIFGGSAEYVALYLKDAGHEPAFYWYVTVMMVIAFLVALRLPRHGSYLHHDH
jgi:MHS family alpha-ketoglutarate permease-like MFS transporter